MTQIIVAQRMWQRRDTAANWTSKNPVLEAGEIGVELGAAPADTKFKIGTGSHSWSILPYQTGDAADLLAFYLAAPPAISVGPDDGVLVLQDGELRITGAGALPGGRACGLLPMVNGDVPPVLMHGDEGELIYGEAT